jgi:hypothetical protein
MGAPCIFTLALLGLGRAKAKEGEAGSSHASTATARREYRVAYIERMRFVQQFIACTGSVTRHAARAPRRAASPRAIADARLGCTTTCCPLRWCLARARHFLCWRGRSRPNARPGIPRLTIADSRLGCTATPRTLRHCLPRARNSPAAMGQASTADPVTP